MIFWTDNRKKHFEIKKEKSILPMMASVRFEPTISHSQRGSYHACFKHAVLTDYSHMFSYPSLSFL